MGVCGGALPVRNRQSDVSVVEAGVPWEQNDAPVSEHAVEEQLTTHGETKYLPVRCECVFAMYEESC